MEPYQRSGRIGEVSVFSYLIENRENLGYVRDTYRSVSVRVSDTDMTFVPYLGNTGEYSTLEMRVPFNNIITL